MVCLRDKADVYWGYFPSPLHKAGWGKRPFLCGTTRTSRLGQKSLVDLAYKGTGLSTSEDATLPFGIESSGFLFARTQTSTMHLRIWQICMRLSTSPPHKAAFGTRPLYVGRFQAGRFGQNFPVDPAYTASGLSTSPDATLPFGIDSFVFLSANRQKVRQVWCEPLGSGLTQVKL